MKFEDYAAEHILKPLGMNDSTFVQPPPTPLLTRVALAYPSASATPLPYFETLPAPVGGLSTTASDMARFLLALLNRDPLTQPALMPPDAFESDYAAGNHFIGKHGLTNAVVSELALLPDSHFGLFASYNSATAGNAPTELLRKFAETDFRNNSPSGEPLSTASADAAAVAGAYEQSQRADSDFLRLRALTQQLVVTPLPDGRIRLSIASQPLIETAPFVFEGARDLKLSFRRGTMTMSAMPLPMQWDRVPWFQDRRLVLPAAAISLLLMIVTLVWRWPKSHRRDFRRVRIVISLDLLAVICLMAFVSTDLTTWNAGLDPLLILTYVAAWAGAAGSLLVAWIAVRFWRDRVGGVCMRLHNTVLALSLLFFAWFSITWRIAGTTLNY